MFIPFVRQDSEGVQRTLVLITDGDPNYPYGDNISTIIRPFRDA